MPSLATVKTIAPEVLWTTWCTVARGRQAEGNSASGRPQHRGSDGFDCCPRRHEIVVLLPNSYFYSLPKHKLLFFWNMKIYSFIHEILRCNKFTDQCFLDLIMLQVLHRATVPPDVVCVLLSASRDRAIVQNIWPVNSSSKPDQTGYQSQRQNRRLTVKNA